MQHHTRSNHFIFRLGNHLWRISKSDQAFRSWGKVNMVGNNELVFLTICWKDLLNCTKPCMTQEHIFYYCRTCTFSTRWKTRNIHRKHRGKTCLSGDIYRDCQDFVAGHPFKVSWPVRHQWQFGYRSITLRKNFHIVILRSGTLNCRALRGTCH